MELVGWNHTFSILPHINSQLLLWATQRLKCLDCWVWIRIKMFGIKAESWWHYYHVSTSIYHLQIIYHVKRELYWGMLGSFCLTSVLKLTVIIPQIPIIYFILKDFAFFLCSFDIYIVYLIFPTCTLLHILKIDCTSFYFLFPSFCSFSY